MDQDEIEDANENEDLAEIDLRDTGYLNPVENQDQGECCYAFVVCKGIEYLHHKQGGNRALLSPQDLYNNLNYNPNAIVQEHGEYLNKTLTWIINNGCVLEASCPYTGVLGPPTPLLEREVRLRIETAIPIELDNIESYIRRKREPVMVELDWIDEMASLGDEDEIYAGPDNATAFNVEDRHALLIVGFGPDYWLVQNSHGTDWGNGGYAKFTRTEVHGRFLINEGGWAAAGITYVDFDNIPYPAI